MLRAIGYMVCVAAAGAGTMIVPQSLAAQECVQCINVWGPAAKTARWVVVPITASSSMRWAAGGATWSDPAKIPGVCAR